MNDEIRAKALALSMREDFVYVTTVDPSGFPETRVMFNFLKMRAEALSSGPAKVPSDFASYLGTNTSSRKVAQMRNDNRICLYYSDNSSYEGCMVRGRVREVSNPDIKKAVWMPEWDMYYPGGLEGGDFSLFLFAPELVRYYHGLGVHEFTP
jgi:general stress protein 26